MHPTRLATEMAYAGLLTLGQRPRTFACMRTYVAAGGPFGAYAGVR